MRPDSERGGASGVGASVAPLAAAAVWGGMYVVSKWSFTLLPPLTMGFLRVVIGGATLYLVVRRRDVTIEPADRGRFVVLGGWVALTIATQFLGTDLTNASQGSLLTVLTPVFTVLLGAALLDESIGARRAIGVGLACLGTVIVLSGRYTLAGLLSDNGFGVGLLLVASLAWAGYTVWGVPVVRSYSALTAVTYSTLFAIPMLGLAAAIELIVLRPSLLGLVTPGGLLAVGYLGFASTAAAWYLWYKGLEYVPAGTVAVYFFAQPVVGGLLGAAVLGERLGALFAGGGVVLAAGVWLVSTAGARADRTVG